MEKSLFSLLLRSPAVALHTGVKRQSAWPQTAAACVSCATVLTPPVVKSVDADRKLTHGGTDDFLDYLKG